MGLMDEQFPFRLDGRIYLNTCGLGIPPRMVVDDLARTYMDLARHPHIEFAFEEDISNYRAHIGTLTNGGSYHLSFTRNVTEGLMLAAQGVRLNSGDQVIVTSLDHRTAVNCWYLRKLHNPELDIDVKIIPIPVEAGPDELAEVILAEVTDRTRVLSIPHVDRYFGMVFPVERICAAVSGSGIITVVDGGQTIGLVDVDLQQIDCDIYVSCLHKWYLAPMTIGTLHISQRVFGELIRTYAAGSRWHDQPVDSRQFGGKELGTRNVAVEKCLGSLIEFHRLYAPGLKRQSNEAKRVLVESLGQLDRIVVASPVDMLGPYGVTTFRAPGIDSDLIINRLETEHGISVGVTNQPPCNWIRASTFFYNTGQDIEQFMGALVRILDGRE